MRYVRGFARFWWDFIVGDDWRVAAGIAVALALTKLLTSNGTNAWWLLPASVALLRAATVWRGTRGRGPRPRPPPGARGGRLPPLAAGRRCSR